jgi:hypothetical protein
MKKLSYFKNLKFTNEMIKDCQYIVFEKLVVC